MKKTYRNDGQGEDNSLQNHFTSYVEKALSNNRITYKRKLARHHRMQLMEDMDSEMVSFSQEQNSPVEEMYEEQYACETDLVENLSLLFALQRLSEKDRMIIRLHVIYEYSYKQIACIMGMTLTAVRSRYSRAIQTIRRQMEDRK